MNSSKLNLSLLNQVQLKMINNLKNNTNVIIFLYRKLKSSGIYWVAKELNCNIVLIKIKSNKKITSKIDDKINLSYIINRTINHQLTVDYHEFNYNKNLLLNKKNFMNKVKNELYI